MLQCNIDNVSKFSLNVVTVSERRIFFCYQVRCTLDNVTHILSLWKSNTCQSSSLWSLSIFVVDLTIFPFFIVPVVLVYSTARVEVWCTAATDTPTFNIRSHYTLTLLFTFSSPVSVYNFFTYDSCGQATELGNFGCNRTQLNSSSYDAKFIIERI